MAESLKVWEPVYKDFDLLERGSAFDCKLFKIARGLVRLAKETAKPNAERLRGYRESNLESLKLELFADTPIYKDLETLQLADSLSYFIETAGYDNKLAKEVLAGSSPVSAPRPWSKAQSSRTWRSEKAGRRRPKSDRSLERSDDPPGPPGQRSRPGRPQNL